MDSHNPVRVMVQQHDFDSAQLTALLRTRNAGQAGAIVTFTGCVRDFAPGQTTRTLFLEHYAGMCEREIQQLCETALTRWPILDVLAVHRHGELAYGDQIVFIGVASAHRSAAFRACEYVIDALKTRAPFWKRETLADGQQFWVQAQGDATAYATADTTTDSAAPAGTDTPAPAP